MGACGQRGLVILFVFTLLLYLVGFGVGIDHEGGMTDLHLPDVLCVCLSGIVATLLSYTLVAEEPEPLVHRGVQIIGLCSFACLCATLGNGGSVMVHCDESNWESPKDHCASSTLQFFSGILHGLVIVAVVLLNMKMLPNKA